MWNISEKTKKIAFMFLIVAFISFLVSDSIVSILNTLPPLVILFIMPFLDPIYIFFLFTLYSSYGFRGAIAAFFFGVASSLISIPHFISKNGEFAGDSINLISDYIFYNILPESMRKIIEIPFIGQVNLVTLIIYVIISTALVLLGFLVAKDNMQNKLFRKAI